ncbi:hypothetical protein BCR42DRAFT_409797 [Absidia repens]|uniref:Uncharacterized protein n=1 Tax=Absidia repens TaxID=90262 RepID=A0A1X2IN51_9FUNG|nr:hypothetical protein BCR42DRAFT_409797 [Absidia repens]
MVSSFFLFLILFIFIISCLYIPSFRFFSNPWDGKVCHFSHDAAYFPAFMIHCSPLKKIAIALSLFC